MLEGKKINLFLKVIILIMTIIMMVISVYLVNKPTNDELRFKEIYESLNNKTNSNGTKYRSVTIPNKNKMVISSFKEINKMIDNKETFYVYFGFESCPWCRSVIEKMIEQADKYNVDKIYYVDVRPGEDSFDTDIRDEYGLDENGNIYLERNGSNDYHTFLKKFDSILNPYSRGDIKTLDGTEFEGQKRLGAPNFIYVKKGRPQKLISGISEKQTDGYVKLTNDILRDEEKAFKKFFQNN